MAPSFSVSRLETFRKCRLQYKYHYLDRLTPEEETVEAFMGSRVHEALKELYDGVKFLSVKPKDRLLARYDDLWTKNLHPALKVVREGLTPEDYHRIGRQALADYYDEYRPFDQAKVVKTEEFISFTLRKNGQEYPFCGVLDRLDWNDRDRMFEIHDYKTSGTLMTQEEADQDDQLGLYHLAVRSQWPEARTVRLVWHYLRFNKEVESRRTEEQLLSLEDELVRRVQEAESCKDFPPAKSALCDWCVYQAVCPLWKHPVAVSKLEPNAYLLDPGVRLVGKYAELEEEKKSLRARIVSLEDEQARVEEAALTLADREDVRTLDGPGHQLIITIKDELAAPLRREDEDKWKGLRDVLLSENRYNDVSTVNNQMLSARLRSWPREFRDKIESFLVHRTVRKVELKAKSR